MMIMTNNEQQAMNGKWRDPPTPLAKRLTRYYPPPHPHSPHDLKSLITRQVLLDWMMEVLFQLILFYS